MIKPVRERQGDKACERARQGHKACEREPGREIKPVRESQAVR